MACFLVPGAEAVIVTAAALAVRAHEKKADPLAKAGKKDAAEAGEEIRIALSRKLMWLAKLLWGGCFLLCFEHIWHGEVVPWFPFLTAAADPAETAVMLAEMRSVGGTMALWLTAVWLIMLLAVQKLAGKKAPGASAA